MIVAAATIDYPPTRYIGSELMTHALLRALVEAGHDVTAYTQHAAGEYVHEGVKVVGSNRPRAGMRMLRAANADVYLVHAELGKWLARASTAVKVGISHNDRTVEQMCGRANWTLMVHNSEAMAATFEPHRQCPHIVVHPPVNWRDYDVDRTGAAAITLINVTGEKGSDTFYELARRMPDRRFLGVLGGWGAPEVKQLPNVELLPHGVDMRDVYRQTRILLMPSEHESWGRVAVEAMSSGIPVLATDLPGPREAIGDGGYLVDLAWTDRYEQLIRLLDNPDEYDRVSTAAVERSRQLDPTATLERFVQTIEALHRRREA